MTTTNVVIEERSKGIKVMKITVCSSEINWCEFTPMVVIKNEDVVAAKEELLKKAWNHVTDKYNKIGENGVFTYWNKGVEDDAVYTIEKDGEGFPIRFYPEKVV